MANIATQVIEGVMEGLHDFTGNDFSFRHNEEKHLLEATHYNDEGEVIGVYEVTFMAKVKQIG